MSGGFRELEGITADVGIEAWGETVAEAFTNAAEGLGSLLADRDTLSGEFTRPVSASADDRTSLLVNFLNEIIFLEETEDFLTFEVQSMTIDGNTLSARISGDSYKPSQHSRNMGIKAATYHGLVIEENADGVRVQVIFDV
jgi:SHS2 domain-containing protein